ncbi:hypothetical protein LGH70_12350 [Hymenobacter sp. BT635]|uniref:DUF3347 domain-containing protein n=1 Tax=Hymenobacter nitidus TaxID=2880929 RepID=A0ABS8AER8_9BACT|nr:hypothetical protein [Hymenobacter nitidus]MCB2378381.1 hypothetical protein [Hymenobacter nitidus]
MKRIIVLLVSGLALHTATWAATPLAGDSLRGQHHFIQKVAGTMCEKLQAETQSRALLPQEAEGLLASITESSMLVHAEELNTLMSDNKVSAPRKVGQKLGSSIVMQLIETCPAGQQLMLSIVSQSLGAKIAISEAEKPVLTLVSADICQRLDTENAARPMASRTPQERQEVFMQVMQGGMLKNMEPLANFYGLDNMKSSKVTSAMGQKIALLITQQCPMYMMRFGIDELLKRQ